MNAKLQLAKKLSEWSQWDANTCDILAERVAQMQRIRAISENAPAEHVTSVKNVHIKDKSTKPSTTDFQK